MEFSEKIEEDKLISSFEEWIKSNSMSFVGGFRFLRKNDLTVILTGEADLKGSKLNEHSFGPSFNKWLHDTECVFIGELKKEKGIFAPLNKPPRSRFGSLSSFILSHLLLAFSMYILFFAGLGQNSLFRLLGVLGVWSGGILFGKTFR